MAISGEWLVVYGISEKLCWFTGSQCCLCWFCWNCTNLKLWSNNLSTPGPELKSASFHHSSWQIRHSTNGTNESTSSDHHSKSVQWINTTFPVNQNESSQWKTGTCGNDHGKFHHGNLSSSYGMMVCRTSKVQGCWGGIKVCPSAFFYRKLWQNQATSIASHGKRHSTNNLGELFFLVFWTTQCLQQFFFAGTR